MACMFTIKPSTPTLFTGDLPICVLLVTKSLIVSCPLVIISHISLSPISIVMILSNSLKRTRRKSWCLPNVLWEKWLQGKLLFGKEGRNYMHLGRYAWSCFKEYLKYEEPGLIPMCKYWPEFAMTKTTNCFSYWCLSCDLGMVLVYRCMWHKLHFILINPVRGHHEEIFSNR